MRTNNGKCNNSHVALMSYLLLLHFYRLENMIMVLIASANSSKNQTSLSIYAVMSEN